MDEWNRFPMNETNEPTVPPTPSEPNEPSAPSVPSEPTVPPVEPQTPPVYTAPSYPNYQWNQQVYAPMQPPKPPKKKKQGAVIAVIATACAVILVVLAVLLVLAYQSMGEHGNGNTADEAGKNKNAPTLQINEVEEDGLTGREIVEKNADSTVLLTIYTTTSVTGGFRFGNTPSEETKAGSASGIIWTSDGYIITNWHCVVDENTNKNFDRIAVTLYDGTEYDNAKVIGADSSTDLAVIKIDATGLKAAEFGDSDALKLGDRVMALGNAGGLGWSATQGIVSGLARDVYEDTGYSIKCLQVDAAINPGNSGGPLFNAAGQVVAVNSSKIVATGYEGLGFSIPISEAKKVLDELVKNGYVTGRASLGITGQTYSNSFYEGFLIYSINDDSPLRNTEAARGDLITAIDGLEVTSYAELRSALAKHKVGDTVTLTILRANNYQVRELTVTTKLVEEKKQ